MDSVTKLTLASGSPRRADLLRQLGLSFSVVVPSVDELPRRNEDSLKYVERMANDKNAEIRKRLESVDLVLSADTVVVYQSRILGKPKSKTEGLSMLRLLSERTHKVITGVTLTTKTQKKFCFVETKVKFRRLSDHEMHAYWMTKEPKDKAGSYGIQGLGALFVSRIEGSYSNVVGLPLMETGELLKQLGVDCLG